MFSLFIMSLPRNRLVLPSLSAWTLVRLGEIINSSRGHAAAPASCSRLQQMFLLWGANRNFIGSFLPFRENCQNSQKWEIYRPPCISKLGGILYPIKGISNRGISEDTISQFYVKCSPRKRETKESSLGFRFLCILKTVRMLEGLEIIPTYGKNTPGSQ